MIKMRLPLNSALNCTIFYKFFVPLADLFVPTCKDLKHTIFVPLKIVFCSISVALAALLLEGLLGKCFNLKETDGYKLSGRNSGEIIFKIILYILIFIFKIFVRNELKIYTSFNPY